MTVCTGDDGHHLCVVIGLTKSVERTGMSRSRLLCLPDAIGGSFPSLTSDVMNEDDRSKNREVLSSAVQKALLSAATQAVGPLRQLRVVINQKSGDIHAFAKL